jgi:uncharacterized protein YggE
MKPSLTALLCLAALSVLPVRARDAEERRSVTVSGRGEISATPDRARLAMSVEATRPELRVAQAEVNRVMREYLAQAHGLGARDEDISTAGLNIRAEYDYTAREGRKFLGYHVTRGVEVVVRDLDKVGDFLLRATEAGINNVSDPTLESSKSDELQRQALTRAAEDARAKAQALAGTLNAKLGAVHLINAGSEITPPPRPMVLMAKSAAVAGSGNEEMGFSAGQIRFSANVTVDFDLVTP